MTPLTPSALQHLRFLAGHWRGEHDGAVIEEAWLAPSAGVAQGSVRLVKNGELHTIELIVVSAENDRVVMRYNHFERTLEPWERDGPIELTLTLAEPSQIVFTNLGAPMRHAAEVGYRTLSASGMRSWVIALDDQGARTRHSFDYRRVL